MWPHLFYAACLKLSINTLHWRPSVCCLLCLSVLSAWCNTYFKCWPLVLIKFEFEIQLLLFMCLCVSVYNNNLISWLCYLNHTVCVSFSSPVVVMVAVWWDYGVGVCSLSTVSPHGLLPPLSFYSLLLGDAALSPNATQAKTPLSSFARACYPGNTAIPPLLF